MARILLARHWRTRRAIIALFAIEFCLTVAALALFGIADPDLYRTRLWLDGAENGFNSNPNEILYAYANYEPIKTPLVWSQFITSFNVVISVLSMFILLVKSVLFVVGVWYPLLSVLAHALLVALYAVSTHAQLAPDMSDPLHPQPGAPWYITKSCKVVHDEGNYGYCRQAKAGFGVTVCMLGLFFVYLLLSAFSAVPSAKERESRAQDLERGKLGFYAPERSQQQQWDQLAEMHHVRTPAPTAAHAAATHAGSGVGAGLRSPTTPRTVAFRTLGGERVQAGNGEGSAVVGLPFRDRYQGPDGR